MCHDQEEKNDNSAKESIRSPDHEAKFRLAMDHAMAIGAKDIDELKTRHGEHIFNLASEAEVRIAHQKRGHEYMDQLKSAAEGEDEKYYASLLVLKDDIVKSEEPFISTCVNPEVADPRLGSVDNSSAPAENITHCEDGSHNGHGKVQPELGNLRQPWSWEEVHCRAQAGDCWLVAHGKVYDASDFVDLHPGGRCLLKCAGKDATRDYDFHTSVGKKSWAKFCIGRIQSDSRGLFGAFGKVWELLSGK